MTDSPTAELADEVPEYRWRQRNVGSLSVADMDTPVLIGGQAWQIVYIEHRGTGTRIVGGRTGSEGAARGDQMFRHDEQCWVGIVEDNTATPSSAP